jgi:3',5'-nucleoside bisphosphate phosphatase
MKNTDLHTHSYFSDGELSPSQVVRLAKKSGIKNMSLTDHDSVKGVEEAIKEGGKIGINVIPGIETRAQGTEVLGYFIDYKNKKFLKQIKKSARKNEKDTKKWCKLLKKAGYEIEFEDLEKNFPKARGNINTKYVIDSLHNGKKERQEFYNEIKKHKPNKKRISIIKAIKRIKKSGGVAVLAHPWIYTKCLEEKNIKKYIKAGLDGIELDNGDKHNLRKKEIVKKIKELSKKYNLVLTAGSDFHTKKGFGFGRHFIGKVKCEEKIINELKKRINR